MGLNLVEGLQKSFFCPFYLELIGKGANGVTLRDQDATNSKDGEWVKVNTLGHYKLDEMVRGRRVQILSSDLGFYVYGFVYPLSFSQKATLTIPSCLSQGSRSQIGQKDRSVVLAVSCLG